MLDDSAVGLGRRRLLGGCPRRIESEHQGRARQDQAASRQAPLHRATVDFLITRRLHGSETLRTSKGDRETSLGKHFGRL